MPKYIIEREVPGAANLSDEELQAISKKSNDVVQEMGRPYTWVESYVAGDKIYCVHIASDERAVREHAQLGGFPITSVTEVKAIIDPATGGQ